MEAAPLQAVALPLAGFGMGVFSMLLHSAIQCLFCEWMCLCRLPLSLSLP